MVTRVISVVMIALDNGASSTDVITLFDTLFTVATDDALIVSEADGGGVSDDGGGREVAVIRHAALRQQYIDGGNSHALQSMVNGILLHGKTGIVNDGVTGRISRSSSA